MTKKLMAEYDPGEKFDGILQVREASLATTKSGSFYIRATLGDRSATVKANLWDAAQDSIASFPVGGYLRLRGMVESYRGQTQLKIDKFRPAQEKEVEAADFEVTGDADIGEMRGEMQRLIASIRDPDISRLLKSIFVEDAAFAEAFARAPGASSYHHAYIGGLLEHSLQMARSADAVAGTNPRLRRDILVSGALLHDIGKMRELSSEAGFNFTDEGLFLGHIYLGASELERRMSALDGFPAELRLELVHLMLSHHGEKEYGSPVLPCTPEALALHHLDNLDAKVQAADSAMQAPAPDGSGWSDFVRMLGCRVRRRPASGAGADGTAQA